jgi:hypothetical protein
LLGSKFELEEMVRMKTDEPSPTSVARANRQRLAREEGVRAMADVEKSAMAVRKNMERLRALREAKEAEEAREASALPIATDIPRKKRKKAVAK